MCKPRCEAHAGGEMSGVMISMWDITQSKVSNLVTSGKVQVMVTGHILSNFLNIIHDF